MMIMMVFVYMMDLLIPQFGVFVPLIVNVFGMFLSCSVFGILLVQVSTSDRGGGGPVVLLLSARRLYHVMIVTCTVGAIEPLLVSNVLVLVILVMILSLVIGRYVRDRFKIVRTPCHFGRSFGLRD